MPSDTFCCECGSQLGDGGWVAVQLVAWRAEHDIVRLERNAEILGEEATEASKGTIDWAVTIGDDKVAVVHHYVSLSLLCHIQQYHYRHNGEKTLAKSVPLSHYFYSVRESRYLPFGNRWSHSLGVNSSGSASSSHSCSRI